MKGRIRDCPAVGASLWPFHGGITDTVAEVAAVCMCVGEIAGVCVGERERVCVWGSE